jgi:hypothetical protein
MADPNPEDVTLNTIHDDLEAGFADLKATLIAGFRSLPARETSEEMVRLLRESNRARLDSLIKGWGDGAPSP